MFSLLLYCEPAEEDLLVAELGEAGSAGLTEEAGGLRAFFEDAMDARAVAGLFAKYAPELRQEADTDWEQVSREAWPAVRVGERFFLAPPWCHDATPAGRLRLEVNPGMACGTGWHPCTQLCLEALEQHVGAGVRVLDVGSGSGILSLAATLLGAELAIGCDVDFEAVTIARERVPCPGFAGSVEAVRSHSMDVIVANIGAATIEALAQEFSRVGKPQSTLILSGFTEADRIEGFPVKKWIKKREWMCAIC